MKRAVHQHDDREVIAARVLEDLVVQVRPTGDALLVVDRIVAEPLPQRDAGQKLVEGERDLCDGRLLLGQIRARGGVDEQLLEVDRAAGPLLRGRVLHAAAGVRGVVLAERTDQRRLRMRVADAPGVQRDLELAIVRVGQMLGARCATWGDLDPECVERFLRVIRG